MYGYIYKTTNIANGKIYIGQHKSNKFDNHYLGSGLAIQNAIKYYEKGSFSVEIIEWCNTLDELNKQEIYWIDKLNSRNKKVGYNITLGGNQISSTPEIASKISKRARERFNNPDIGKRLRKSISKAQRGKKLSPEHKKKFVKAMILRERIAEENIKRSNSLKGHIVTNETKKKISDGVRRSSLGRHWYNNGNVEVYQYECPKGFTQGRLPMRNESKIKLSKSQKGREITKETRDKLSQGKKGNKNPCYGKKAINNGSCVKYILPEDIDEYLQKGWKLGNIYYRKGRG